MITNFALIETEVAKVRRHAAQSYMPEHRVFAPETRGFSSLPQGMLLIPFF
jgi:hypothetical protein